MYGKIFESIFDSTLAAEGGWLPTYVFMSLIALADKNGIVPLASRSLYRRIGLDNHRVSISYEEFQEAIDYLNKEDSESNSPEMDGRRIVPLSEISEDQTRGWWIVNYKAYSEIARKRDSQQATNERVKKFREKKKQEESETPCNAGETLCNAEATVVTTHVDVPVTVDSNKTLMSIPGEIDLQSKTQSDDKSKTPPCPHIAIIDLYHEILPELPRVNKGKWRGERKTHMATRWKEDPKHQDLRFWRQFFEVCRLSDHWMGRTETQGKHQNWKATLEFLVKQKNFDKVYDMVETMKQEEQHAAVG